MRLSTTILSALSALLFVVIVVFWVRSYWFYEGVVYYSESGKAVVALAVKGEKGEGEIEGKSLGIMSRRGALTIASIADPTKEPIWQFFSDKVAPLPPPGPATMMFPTLAKGGLTIGSDKAMLADKDLEWQLPFWRVGFPYWLPAALSAILPWLWIKRFMLIAQREKAGQCIYCGQSLNGASTCTKCGKAVPV